MAIHQRQQKGEGTTVIGRKGKPSPNSLEHENDQGGRNEGLPANALRSRAGLIQPKLSLGQADDHYEREADTIAQQVLSSQPVNAGQFSKLPAHSAQRVCSECEEEVEAPQEEQSANGLVQRMSAGDEEEEAPAEGTVVQAKLAAGSGGKHLSNSTSTQIQSRLGAGNSLGGALLNQMQTGFGRDFSHIRLHTDSQAGQLASQINARAFTLGRDIFFGQGEYQPESQEGQFLLAHELAHTVQQGTGTALGAKQTADAPSTVQGMIQRKEPEKSYVIRYVNVVDLVDQEQFKVIATAQIFGAHPPSNLNWTLDKPNYGPNARVSIRVQADLLLASRSEAAKDKGMGVGQDGSLDGSKERAKTFLSGPNTATKKELMSEIDRRYYEATGITPGEKIKGTKADQGKRELWNQIRDEVLYQHEYIQKLPPEVKRLIKITADGKPITMAEIEQLFLIAKKIEAMDGADVLDYASKVNASTTDLDVFEASLDKYIAEVAERKQEQATRIDAQDKLAGHDNIYKLWKKWKEPIPNLVPVHDGMARDPGNATANKMHRESVERERRQALETALTDAGFSGIAEFEKYIDQVRSGFQEEAVKIVLDILARYEGTLYQEGQRYKDPAELSKFYDSLAPFRAKYMDAAAKLAISSRENAPQEIGNIPHNTNYDPDRAASAKAAADVAVADAKQSVVDLTPKHPLLGEDHLDVSRRIDKQQLATVDKAGLGKLIQDHIAARIKDVHEARQRLVEDKEMVFQMKEMLPQFKAEMGIASGSISDQIINDKVEDIKDRNTLVSVVLGILAIALAIVSFGTATPWIAAAAAAGGLTISAYSVYDEYHKYAVQKDLADVGLADDPSMIWLIVAVVGAGLDMAAAVKAVRAIGPLAKTMMAPKGSMDDFAKALKELEKQNEISGKVAKSVEEAARARKAYAEATEELSKALAGKLYSFPGPLADPDVIVAVFKMAKARVKQAGATFEIWLQELNAMRIAKSMTELDPKEVKKARQIWKDAKALEASATEPVEVLVKKKLAGVYSHGVSMEVKMEGVTLYGGNTIKLSGRTTTVTGTMDDLRPVRSIGREMKGSVTMGDNAGGINVLQSPKWYSIQEKHIAIKASDPDTYWKLVSDEFWEQANKPWLEAAIQRGDDIRLVSNPLDDLALHVTEQGGTKLVLNSKGEKIPSIFSRELELLKANGYTFRPDGMAVKATP